MAAYYNEIDPFTAQWLRELINAGAIAPGDVDERDIADVTADDLAGYDQCHFFAGIGVWSYALRLAGWPDDRPVWTGSCPCQPFSSAGKRAGFTDERHLWPEFFRLIRECRPATVFGEQVASKDGLAWLDLVQNSLESAGYACGALDTCAAGVGAPHIRQRLYWVANAIEQQHKRRGYIWSAGRAESANGSQLCRMGHAGGAGLEGHARHGDTEAGRQEQAGSVTQAGRAGGMGNTNGQRRDGQHALLRPQTSRWHEAGVSQTAWAGAVERSSPTDGFWRAADWIYCRDGQWRPVEPGTCPLAARTASDLGRLRGYGNALNAVQAQAFIEAVIQIKQKEEWCG